MTAAKAIKDTSTNANPLKKCPDAAEKTTSSGTEVIRYMSARSIGI